MTTTNGNQTFQGNVGIGTTDIPANSRLAVVGGAITVGSSPQTADAAIHITSSFGGFDRLLQMSPTGPSKPGLNLLASHDAAGNEQWWAWGVTTDYKWRIQPGTTFGGSGGLTIDSAGNVGIGTDQPKCALDVKSSNAIKLGLEGNGGGQLVLGNNKGDNKIFLEAFNAAGDGSADELLLTGCWSRNVPKLSLWADTTCINGNVGIGTTAPQVQLAINNASAGAAIQVDGNNGQYGLWLGADENHPWIGSKTNHDLRIITNNLEKIRITKEGNVGIGTTSPDPNYKLDVNGSLKVTGDIQFGATLSTPGRMHITGGELLYLLNKSGVIIGKEWGGNGNLSIEGCLSVGGTAPGWLARLTIEDSAVPLAFRETDRAVNDGGLWRMPLDGGVLRFDVNTDPDPDHVFRNFLVPLAMTKDGNVGIGTIYPEAKLTIQGDVAVRNSSNQCTIRLDAQAGDIILENADCAEDFDVVSTEAIEPGTVVVIHDDGKLGTSTQAYDKRVAGVISGAGECRPGIVLGKQPGKVNRQPIALLGKVYCKVDASFAAIEVGDLLTTSPTLGHAMKAQDPLKTSGSIIGKALEPLRSGQGMIPILVALQ